MKFFLSTLVIFSLFVSTGYAGSSIDIIAGGRLYDKWWVDADLSKPTDTHPAYPAEGKKKGASTWRCKECHGWDYRGKDGAYKKGSHFTGIKGIRNKAGENIKAIITILKDKRHQFDTQLPADALKALAKFVSQGQIDMSQYIDDASKKVKGNAKQGKKSFVDQCQSCHGKDGKALNLSHKKGSTESIGSIANKNPWETLHKIRFGHPGAVMSMDVMHNSRMGMRGRHGMGMSMWEAMPPMFEELSDNEQVDLLTYLQTLPK